MQKKKHPASAAGDETTSPAHTYRELEKIIGHVPVIFKDLAQTDAGMHDAILKLDSFIWSDGKLSRTDKKLIAVAVAAALRDNHALNAQLHGAKKLGISLEEIDEALRVSFMLSGMPAYVSGKTAAEKLYR
ncbi:MAG TPA: carboxymuconolactone decarboxylase family protein [Methanocorpusculum sp.]|nr:carboxymuconolactone decarboxylase family protein [Methanocorpusculum sp.]